MPFSGGDFERRRIAHEIQTDVSDSCAQVFLFDCPEAMKLQNSPFAEFNVALRSEWRFDVGAKGHLRNL